MVFAPKKLPVRTAPVFNGTIGGTVMPGSSLGPGLSMPKALAPAAVSTYRTAPLARPMSAPAAVRSSPVGPRIGITLPASVTAREIAYRLRSNVERMVGAQFMKFDVVQYRVLSVPAAQPSVEERLARATELAASKKAWDHVHGAVDFGLPEVPPPFVAAPARQLAPYLNPNLQFDYFGGLKSQQAQGHVHIYFLKVDAAWAGGFAHLHIRVRAVPPERTPLGTPCAIPPVTEHKLVLEGLLTNLSAVDPLVEFPPSVSSLADAPQEYTSRLRRAGLAY